MMRSMNQQWQCHLFQSYVEVVAIMHAPLLIFQHKRQALNPKPSHLKKNSPSLCAQWEIQRLLLGNPVVDKHFGCQQYLASKQLCHPLILMVFFETISIRDSSQEMWVSETPFQTPRLTFPETSSSQGLMAFSTSLAW